MVHAVRMMPSHSSGLFVLAKGVCDDKIVVICELKEPQTSVVGGNVAVGPLLFRPVFCSVFSNSCIKIAEDDLDVFFLCFVKILLDILVEDFDIFITVV